MEKQEPQKHKETAEFHSAEYIEIQENPNFEKYIKISPVFRTFLRHPYNLLKIKYNFIFLGVPNFVLCM
jgi:hypothetical protein